jgi:predicted TPR repeat methyltransferase
MHPDAGAHLARCRALVEAGQHAEAAAAFERWLALDPGNATALYLRAAWLGEAAPPRAPDRYVVELFDGAAPLYDLLLRALGYAVPGLLAAALAEEFPTPAPVLDVLDAGCGTGLCGPALRPHARRLEGVDLSAAMLELARLRGCYDALAATELTAHLAARPGSFDLIVAADVLVYFGDLEPILCAAAAALRPGGLLLFTVEHAAAETPGGYRLAATGRYAHAAGYLRATSAAAGLDPGALAEVALRRESDVPVAGLLARAVRRPNK